VTRRAIISDIHGNLEALTTVLDDIASANVDEIFCLGDVVGYGPNPRECIDHCRNFSMTLLGNHDNGALFDPDGFSSGAEKAIFWTRQQLEDPQVEGAADRWDFLAKLPRTHRCEPFMFVHGSPRSPLNEYVFPEDHQYCFQGHTHVPGVFTENCRFYSPQEIENSFSLNEQKVMVNVGSVGQPRDGDPRSSYVIVDDKQIEFRRVEYDFEATRAKIHAEPGLDDFLGDRLVEGR